MESWNVTASSDTWKKGESPLSNQAPAGTCSVRPHQCGGARLSFKELLHFGYSTHATDAYFSKKVFFLTQFSLFPFDWTWDWYSPKQSRSNHLRTLADFTWLDFCGNEMVGTGYEFERKPVFSETFVLGVPWLHLHFLQFLTKKLPFESQTVSAKVIFTQREVWKLSPENIVPSPVIERGISFGGLCHWNKLWFWKQMFWL